MFEELIQKFESVLKNLRGMGKLTEKNIAESLREIRRVLLEADVHYQIAKDFIAKVQEKAVGNEVLQSLTPGKQVVKIVHDELVRLLGESNAPIHLGGMPPASIMAVGLQGSGKTTFAGKLGHMLRKKNHRPLLVAADIYRPAAVEQLETLGKSVDIPVFSLKNQSPVAIAKEAVSYARSKNHDILILDTAGRLHVDGEMMDELAEIKKAVKPSEILFVADGMTGQDAVRSAQAFLERLDFDGIVLTKMDGDARGGAALSIRAVTGKPIKFVTTGERLDGIEPFHPGRMASRILGMGDVVTLVEKVQEATDREKAEKIAQKLKTRTFDLESFYDQLQQIKRMGPIGQLVGMIPGMGRHLGNVEFDDKELVKIEAIINSMTREERQKPQLINGNRRKRIAAGSGTSVQDINQLLNQFQAMQKMMKKMGRFGAKGFPKAIPIGL